MCFITYLQACGYFSFEKRGCIKIHHRLTQNELNLQIIKDDYQWMHLVGCVPLFLRLMRF